MNILFTTDEPEANVAVPVGRNAPTAARRADVLGVVAPGTAATHPLRASLGSLGVDGWLAVVRLIPVRAPLVDIAQHVVEPERIRELRPRRMRASTLVGVLLPRPFT